MTEESRTAMNPQWGPGRGDDRFRSVQRCEANAVRGTGTGLCNRPLDEYGYCDRPSDHLETP
jgi:hypothetical protein